jgi:hypothetical protein
LASFKDKDFVRVDDSIETMSNSNDSGLLEGIIHGSVDYFLGFDIDIGGCLVNENDFGRF